MLAHYLLSLELSLSSDDIQQPLIHDFVHMRLEVEEIKHIR